MLNHPRNRRLLALMIAAAITCAVTPWLEACDTPVYRYAMYRWQPALYEIYYFHTAPPTAADEKTHEAINNLIDRQAPQTNVMFIKVDLNKDQELRSVPPDVRKAWQSKDQAPAYLVVNSHGIEVFAGPLGEQEVEALAESKVRREIGDQLKKGHAGVLVLLESGDTPADKAAKTTAQKVVQAVNNGELDLYQAPFNPLVDEQAEEPPPAQTSLITVSRTDEKEAWLARSLLAVESDLPELDQPMVFIIYGRGRALPPYVGAGITYTNLVDVMHFITGACSCTVKDQNPGVDLLMTYDWDAAADALLNKFGVEEGNEGRFSGLDVLPQLILPGEGGAQAKPADDEEAVVADVAEVVHNALGESEGAEQAVKESPASEDFTAAVDATKMAVAKTEEKRIAKAQSPMASSRHIEQSAAAEGGLMMSLSLAIAAGFVLLLVGTYFMMRPQN